MLREETGNRKRPLVLSLLAKHGPLSIRALEASIVPHVSRKKLNVVLSRMKRAGLITERHSDLFRGGGIFYQLAQAEGMRVRIARALNLPIERIANHGIRNFDLLHSESCAVWAEYFSWFFPEASVHREFEFSTNEEIASVILATARDRDFVPDHVLIFPPNGEGRKIYIAVEVERSGKSRDRLHRKLTKYGDESRFDGLIYICDSDSISARLRDVYRASVLRKSLRIQHYGANFFLFSDGSAAAGKSEALLFNAAFEQVELRHWVSVLRRDSLFERRDSKFKKGEPPPPLAEG